MRTMKRKGAFLELMMLAVAAFMTGVVVTAALIKKRNRTETEIKQEERRS